MKSNIEMRPKARKGKYDNPYVAERVNEIRMIEAMMLPATHQYPRETRQMRWKRWWDEATEGLAPVRKNALGQCSECGDVVQRREFRMAKGRIHDCCVRCRPRVNARRKYQADKAERYKREREFHSREHDRRNADIATVTASWNKRTAENRNECKRLARLGGADAPVARTRRAYARRMRLARYHRAVRDAMTANHANHAEYITAANHYFTDPDLRDAYGIARIPSKPGRDCMADVID